MMFLHRHADRTGSIGSITGALLAGLILLGVDSRSAWGAVPTTAPATAPAAKSSADDPLNRSTAAAARSPATGRDLSTLSLEDLMSMEITSVSKTRQRMADAPAAVNVITQEDIQRSGLHEIPDILRLSPGLFIQRGGSASQWTVASRGLAYDFNNNLLVLQDGRSLYTPVSGTVVWDTVDYPIADLERIEVIRGPGATLWGANAVNGVINITTKSARDTQGGLVEARGGSDVSDMTLRFGGKIGPETYFRIYGKGKFVDDLAIQDADQAQNRYATGQVGFRADHYASSVDHVTIQGDAFRLDGEAHTPVSLLVPPYSSMNHDGRHISGANLLARWTHTVSADSEYSLQTYFDRLLLKSVTTSTEVNTFDVEFQHRFNLMPRHDLIYGVNARLQPFDSKPGGSGLSVNDPLSMGFNPQSLNLYLFSAFVQDTLTLVPKRVKLIVGSKFEFNDATGFEVEPSGRVVWTPSERDSVWAGVSRAVRSPGLDNRAFRLPVAAFPIPGQPGVAEVLFTGNPQVNSEELIAFELGYRKQITDTWSIDAAAFLNEHDDLLVAQGRAPVFVPTPVPHIELVSMDINGARVESYGTEISSSLHVTPTWRLTGSYSLLMSHVVSREPNVTTSGTFHQSPQHQFQIHSYFDITPRLQLNSSIYHVGSSHDSQIASYSRLDVNITWKPKAGLELQVGVQNALDHQHGEILPRRGGRTEIERAAYGQVTWRF